MPRVVSSSRAALALIAGAALAQAAHGAPPKLDVPAGRYELDRNHASLTIRVMHMGLSNYTARFTRLGGFIELDPARIERSKVTATVDPASIETDYPGETDFDGELASKPEYLDAKRHPQARFVSRSIRVRDDGTLDVTGDLTLRGVSRPLTLNVKINGAKQHPFRRLPVIGISARGSMQRSQWGVSGSLPTIAGDLVSLEIEAEFMRATGNQPARGP
jgi:polyisoprenoid-binding protein YceI